MCGEILSYFPPRMWVIWKKRGLRLETNNMPFKNVLGGDPQWNLFHATITLPVNWQFALKKWPTVGLGRISIWQDLFLHRFNWKLLDFGGAYLLVRCGCFFSQLVDGGWFHVALKTLRGSSVWGWRLVHQVQSLLKTRGFLNDSTFNRAAFISSFRKWFWGGSLYELVIF